MAPIASKSVHTTQVPDVGDPERKRMLNVLAQRRYRKRKRERIAALEAQVKKSSSKAESTTSPEEQVSESPASEANSETASSTVASSTSPNENDLQSETDRQFTFAPSEALTTAVDWNLMPVVDSGPLFDVSGFFDQLNSPSFDFDPFSDGQSRTRAITVPTATSIAGSSPRLSDFMDDVVIDVPILKIHKAGLELASLLGCAQQMFDPSVSRVLLPLADPRVPAWLQPTTAQQTIPHHPFIDILPWPSVRTRLLVAFSQPAHLRPPAARDENGLMRLMADTDSEVEGCRVNGDGFQADDWEIGQSFFTNWWWALDPHIVDISNERRLKRGAGRLQLTAS